MGRDKFILSGWRLSGCLLSLAEGQCTEYDLSRIINIRLRGASEALGSISLCGEPLLVFMW
jgi:hypothetical protein